MAEVARQLVPFETALKALHEWQLSFWSNGTGRPPGFFQSRIKADDERYKKLEDETKEQSGILAKVHDFMVSQVARAEAREKAEKDRADRHKLYMSLLWKIGAPIAGAILSLVGWGVSKAVPVIRILIDDYLRAHPAVTTELQKRSSASADPVVSYERQGSESAHIPNLR